MVRDCNDCFLLPTVMKIDLAQQSLPLWRV